MDPTARSNQFTTSLVLVSRADFCHFYDDYAPRLYGHLLRQGYPAVSAQRLLEKTFSRCWQDRDQLNNNSSGLFARHPLSWLLYQTQRVDPVLG